MKQDWLSRSAGCRPLSVWLQVHKIDTHVEFEAVGRKFLAEHPEIRHEWRQISEFADSRTDLVCEPGSDHEVFATLRSWQIVIGTKNEDTDFEDFGRGLSDKAIALEAFEHFVALLKRNGLVGDEQRN